MVTIIYLEKCSILSLDEETCRHPLSPFLVGKKAGVVLMLHHPVFSVATPAHVLVLDVVACLDLLLLLLVVVMVVVADVAVCGGCGGGCGARKGGASTPVIRGGWARARHVVPIFLLNVAVKRSHCSVHFLKSNSCP